MGTTVSNRVEGTDLILRPVAAVDPLRTGAEWRGIGTFLLGIIVAPPGLAYQCAPEEVIKLESPWGRVGDGFGQQIAITDRNLAVVVPQLELALPGHGAILVYERTGSGAGDWTMSKELRVHGSSPFLLNNCSLHMDADTIVLGTPEEDTLGAGAGAAYVFERTEGWPSSWAFDSKLVPSDSQHGAWFGARVVVAGDTIAIGSPLAMQSGLTLGATYVFERSRKGSGGWLQTQKLAPAQLVDSSFFGFSLALNDRRLVVGAPFHDEVASQAGAAFVFERDGPLWRLETVLTPTGLTAGDRFGSGLALDGDRLVAGSPGHDVVDADEGGLHVFESKGSGWTLSAVLEPLGLSAHAGFGAPIAIEDGTIYGAALLADASGPISGAVVGFREDVVSGAWYQSALITPSDGDHHDNFGRVALSNGILAASAPKSLKPGAVYLFASRDQRTVATYCTGAEGRLRDCVPVLGTLGMPTASMTSTFHVFSRTVPGGNFGLFLYTTAASATPDLEASGVCLPSGGVRRSGILWSGGTAGACDGTLDVDWNVFGAALAADDPALAEPGTTVHGQFVWFEPLGVSALTWSDAVAFQLCP